MYPFITDEEAEKIREDLKKAFLGLFGWLIPIIELLEELLGRSD